MDLGCGITLDIFTHVVHGSFFFFLNFIKRYKKIHDDMKKYMMMIWMTDIMLSPAMKILSIAEITKNMFTYKSYCERYEDYLNGTLGSGDELPEDNMSFDVITPVLG